MTLDKTYQYRAGAQWLCLLAVMLVLGRVIVVLVSPFELYADEAQYWRWGQDPQWGYYSKPPLIAWLLGAVTGVLGNAEWAVRVSAPLLHGFAAYCLYRLGKDMRDSLTGAMAAIGYLMMPGVILSSSVMSTDGLLLPIFSLALWRSWVFRGRADWLSVVLIGVAIGLGFLAKYAMLFFVLGTILSVILDPAARRAWVSLKGVVITALALAILAPHIWWSVATEFQTLGHTVDNANLSGPLFNPDHLGKFVVDQMGVFGPISFVFFAFGAIIMAFQSKLKGAQGWLLYYCVPVLLIIGAQAVLSRAHANWAASAYPAASVFIALAVFKFDKVVRLWLAIIALTSLGFLFAPNVGVWAKAGIAAGVGIALLVAAILSQWRASGVFWTSVILHATIALIFPVLMLLPDDQADALGLSNSLKRVRGWENTATAVFDKAEAIGATAILTDEREIWHALDYYGRNRADIPVYSWRRYGVAKSFAEAEALDPNTNQLILVASYRPTFRPLIRAEFNALTFAGDHAEELGARANGCALTRRLVFYEAIGFNPRPYSQAQRNADSKVEEFPNPPCLPKN